MRQTQEGKESPSTFVKSLFFLLVKSLSLMSLSKLWEFVMVREAWRAAVHRVTKSRTRQSNRTELKVSVCFALSVSEFLSLSMPLSSLTHTLHLWLSLICFSILCFARSQCGSNEFLFPVPKTSESIKAHYPRSPSPPQPKRSLLHSFPFLLQLYVPLMMTFQSQLNVAMKQNYLHKTRVHRKRRAWLSLSGEQLDSTAGGEPPCPTWSSANLSCDHSGLVLISGFHPFDLHGHQDTVFCGP